MIKNHKKFVLLAIGILLLSLVGCGAPSATPAPTTVNTPTPQATATATDIPATAIPATVTATATQTSTPSPTPSPTPLPYLPPSTYPLPEVWFTLNGGEVIYGFIMPQLLPQGILNYLDSVSPSGYSPQPNARWIHAIFVGNSNINGHPTNDFAYPVFEGDVHVGWRVVREIYGYNGTDILPTGYAATSHTGSMAVPSSATGQPYSSTNQLWLRDDYDNLMTPGTVVLLSANTIESYELNSSEVWKIVSPQLEIEDWCFKMDGSDAVTCFIAFNAWVFPLQ